MNRCLVIALLVGAFVAGTARASGTRLGPWLKDYRNGYAVRIPKGWSTLPPDTGNNWLIAGFYGPKRGSFPPTMKILRLPRLLPLKQGTKTGLRLPEGMQPKLGPDDPVNVRDWLDRELEPYGPLGRIEEMKKIRFGGRKGVVYEATMRRNTARSTALVRMFVAVARTDHWEFGLVLAAEHAELGERHKRAFAGIVRSFKVLDIKHEKDVDYEEAFAGEDRGGRTDDEQEKWIAMVKKKVSGTPGWGHLTTANYIVLYDETIRPAKVMRVAVHIEAIRRDVFEKLFKADEPIRAVSIVRVCKDQEQYLAYGAPEGSAGYWHPAAKELVFYVGGPGEIRVLYHEAFHQYIFHAFGEVSPHIWFNEGHGDYFAGFNYRGRFVPGKLEWRRETIRQAITAKAHVPLELFLRFTQQEYYADARLCYAQGWSFVYFLRHTANEKYRMILPTYFEILKKELAGGKGCNAALTNAQAAAFQGIDLGRLERDWRAFKY